MKQIIYILEVSDDKRLLFNSKDLFYQEWINQLDKGLIPVAYIIDYSRLDSQDFKEHFFR